MSRVSTVSTDMLLPWTIFQSDVEPDHIHSKRNSFFNPIIMAPPNDYSTVYTPLKSIKEQINALDKKYCSIFSPLERYVPLCSCWPNIWHCWHHRASL